MTWAERVDILVERLADEGVSEEALGAVSVDLKDLHEAVEHVAELLEDAIVAKDPASRFVDIQIELERHLKWHRRSLSRAMKDVEIALASSRKSKKKARRR